MIRYFSVLSLFMGLCGCSTYQENFDCPVGEGLRCSSLSTINKKMDRGEINLGEHEGETEPSVDRLNLYMGPKFLENLSR